MENARPSQSIISNLSLKEIPRFRVFEGVQTISPLLWGFTVLVANVIQAVRGTGSKIDSCGHSPGGCWAGQGRSDLPVEELRFFFCMRDAPRAFQVRVARALGVLGAASFGAGVFFQLLALRRPPQE